MFRHCSAWWFFLVSCSLTAQEEKPFAIRFQKYLKGDVTFIANSIVGKKSGENANEAYDKTGSNAKLNDQVAMVYTDVDTDETTFSSSTATLKPIHEKDQIVFAGLYWSATLPEKERVLDKHPLTQIQLKTPAYDNYFTIQGEMVYDSNENPKHKVNAPYVCFANVTEFVRKNPWGAYTVANIQASQEKIEGGSAGGWVLYVVYQSDAETDHYISLYDGFSYIYNKPVDLVFKDFKTPTTGKITPKLTMATLEGDLNIEGDNLRINTPGTAKWSYLNTPLRSGQNVFNSRITMFQQDFMERQPASLNTLGYDVFLEKIQFKDQSFVAIDQVNLKISSVGDKFYVTNVGFSIEVDETFAKEKALALQSQTAVKTTAIETPKGVLESPNPTVVPKGTPNTPTTSKTETPTKLKTSSGRLAKETKTYLFDATVAPEGYYIIANAYQNKAFAEDFAKKLTSKKLRPYIYKNPDNQLHYLSLQHYATQEEAEKAYFNNINNSYFQEYWIAKIQHTGKALTTTYKDKARSEKEIGTIKVNSTSTLKKGYYLVANVFEIPSNASNYLDFLRKKGFTPQSFINPINQYHYTYLAYYTDLATAKADYFSNFNNRFFDNYWLMEVVVE